MPVSHAKPLAIQPLHFIKKRQHYIIIHSADRYDYGVAVFDNFIWVFGGREVNPRNAYNDVWYSPNGTDWIQQTGEAPWTRRSGGFSIVLHDKLFLYGGKHTGYKDGFSGDIWTLERNDLN